MASRFRQEGEEFAGLTGKDECNCGYYCDCDGYSKGPFNGTVKFKPNRLEKPFHWKKPRRIFVTSMGDLWHPSVTREQRAAVFGVICSTPHIYLDLTKRPENRLEWFSEKRTTEQWMEWLRLHMNDNGIKGKPNSSWPPPNYWSGVSVEDQKTADDRIPLLLHTSAAKRFVSYEPALGPLNFSSIQDGRTRPMEFSARYLPFAAMSLIICGAETGPHKRPMSLDWARSVRDQCKAAGVHFWFKKDSYGNETLDGVDHHPEFWR